MQPCYMSLMAWKLIARCKDFSIAFPISEDQADNIKGLEIDPPAPFLVHLSLSLTTRI